MSRLMPPPTTEQLLAALDALRTLGFFPSRGALSTVDLLQTIQAEHGQDWVHLCANLASPAALDQFLVWQDHERVWSRDLEGVYPGEEAYAVTLAELAAIARGGFAPSDVSETWASPAGPAVVRYTARGVDHEFVHQDGRSDFLDLRLVAQINALLGPGGTQFAVCDDFLPDGNFIVALYPEEVKPLLQRGWGMRTEWMA
jgi:hypothetical protein